MYVNSIIKQTTQEFDQNRKIKFTQETKIVNVNVWTQVSQRLSFQTCQNSLKKKPGCNMDAMVSRNIDYTKIQNLSYSTLMVL